MLEERLNELRYELGDAMGDHAPEAFRRTRSYTRELLIGAGSVLIAVGVGYLAMRLSDRRIDDLLDRLVPGENGRERRPEVREAGRRQGRSRRESGRRQSEAVESDEGRIVRDT